MNKENIRNEIKKILLLNDRSFMIDAIMELIEREMKKAADDAYIEATLEHSGTMGFSCN